MKKILFTIAIAAMALASCTKTEIVMVDELSADVQLSLSQAVIPLGGGEVTVLVSANCDWTYANEGDWMDITRAEDRLVISSEPNTTPRSRTAVIVVTATTQAGSVDRALVKVVQPAYEVIDLSASATANSYIVHTGASYRFNANVKGNGATDGDSYYFMEANKDIREGEVAVLLWEATFDGDKTRSCHIISGSPVYDASERNIYFNTGTSEGNAVVAVAKADGTVLWSWHIWVTDTPVTEVATPTGYALMDRNLGAMNNTPGDVSNRGLLYQWGRKDPFLPSRAPYVMESEPTYLYNDATPADEVEAIIAECNRLEVEANVANDQTGDGDGAWTTIQTPIELKAPGNLPYSISHPMAFFTAASGILGNYVFDWYLVRDIDTANDVYMQSFSDLWGANFTGRPMKGDTVESGYKTIFDPCPPGWSVPVDGLFNTKEQLSSSTGFELPLSYKEEDDDPDRWHKDGYGWIWDEGGAQYFPCAGYRTHYSSAILARTGCNMVYWTNRQVGNYLGKSAALFVDGFYYTADETRQIMPFLCYGVGEGDPFADYYNQGSRLFGGTVRCMKEK